MRNPLHLARGEVHSWSVTLDASAEVRALLYATLAPDERDRSARLRFERDLRRFVVARGALRDLLGRYLAIDPDQIRFVYNEFGKPELSAKFGRRIKFNVSHSADLALIAISADADVGVDLEFIRPESDYAEIARTFFSAAEVEHLNRLPSQLRDRAFFSCWTRNEACVKARGVSLSTAPLGDALSVYTLQPSPRYVGALAIEGSGWSLRRRHWRC